MKKEIKDQKAITLIALVITIIILLILAGISIASLTGSGLFERAKESKEVSEKAQIKEEIEMAIMDIQIEEISKGNNVTLKSLSNEENGQLVNKLEGITATLNDEEINGEYKGYEYTIDNNLKVTVGDPIKGISFYYTLTPKGYTNGNITLTVNAKSTNGNITNIEVNGLTRNVDGTFTIIQNGEYQVTVTDSAGETKTKPLNIQKIDKVSPVKPEIQITDIKSNGFTIEANAQDNESGIKRYEYYVGGTKYDSTESTYIVTGLNTSTSYEVYVIVYDNAENNSEPSNKENVTTTEGGYPTLTPNGFVMPDEGLAQSAIQKEAFDKKVETEMYVNTETWVGSAYFKIDPSCWGKYLVVYTTQAAASFGTQQWPQDMGGGWLPSSPENKSLIARCMLIPEGSLWARVTSGSGGSYINEVWCSNENITGNVYTNEELP